VSALPLSRRLDLICLRPDASRADYTKLCTDARNHGCQAVCVPGSRVELAVELLADSPVKVAALVGFPFGTADADAKRYEAEAAVDAGAQELEVVINPGLLKDGADRRVLRELRDLREAAEERPVKAILELGLLTPDEARRGGQLTLEAELQFLVTATGCAARPTTVEDLRLLRETVGPELGIKAVGGILTPVSAEALVAAGASRLGVFTLAPLPRPTRLNRSPTG
jgi:deoxyribose-phosphate aldolase